MADTVWMIDPDTRDLVFDGEGILATLEGDEASAQRVRMALGAWKGDFPLVPEHGADYGRILGQPADEDAADEVVREAIFQEERVASLDTLDMSVDGGRGLMVSFSGCLDDGQRIDMEVSVDG